MTTDQFIAARQELGLSRPEMAVALGLRGDHSVKTIERLESGSTITGPMALAVQKLLDDHRRAPPAKPLNLGPSISTSKRDPV